MCRAANSVRSVRHNNQTARSRTCGGEDDWSSDVRTINTFEMEWLSLGASDNPPELDREVWFDVTAARERILKKQAMFLDR
jgi:predicted NUDIX family NTP pyrophosphohydrolase